MKKATVFCVLTLVGFLHTTCALSSKPIPLNGYYVRDLDRSKQTFNGKLNGNTRPWQQTEKFSTTCNASGCIAGTPNLYAPPGAPKSIDYRWIIDHWQLTTPHLFNCNDAGGKVKSVLSESIKANRHGGFSGQRSIVIEKPGCPGEGPGIYEIPFTLSPRIQ